MSRQILLACMGFALTIFYLFSTFLTPAEIMPVLLPYRIMLVLLLLTLFVSTFTMLGSRFSFKEPQLIIMLALVVDAALTVLYALRWLAGAFDAVLDLLFLAGILLMVCWNVTSIARLRVLAAVLAFTGIIITAESVIALETGYRSKDFIIHENGSEDQETGNRSVDRIRGLGVLADPNDLGQFLLVDIALLGCCWKPGRFLSNLFGVLLPSSILVAGVLLTRSRGALLALLILILLLLQKHLGKVGTAIGLIGGGLGLLAMTVLTGRGISMQESSAAGRLDAWYIGMQLFKSSPLLGIGFGRFTEYNVLTAHNSYMLCLAELGFPGLCLWLSLIIASTIQVRSLSMAAGETPEMLEIKRAARSVYFAFVMFAVTAWFLSRTYATILFALVGCAVAVAEIARRSGLIEIPKVSWKMMTAASAVAVIIALYVILRIRGLSA